MIPWRFTGGLPETKCGLGSTLETTENLRLALTLLVRSFGIETLIDVPCGDCNWISRVDLGDAHYIGIDQDADHLSVAVQRQWSFPPASVSFVSADAMQFKLSPCDAILCRDFLQHLTTTNAEMFVDNLFASSWSWLFATSHTNEVNEEIESDGMFRPLNLCLPPFSFPVPTFSIFDPPGSGRILGCWQRGDIE